MGDILRNEQTPATNRREDSRGYVGASYKVTPLPDEATLKAYAARRRLKLGIEVVGHQAVDPTGLEKGETESVELEQKVEPMARLSHARPGWWF